MNVTMLLDMAADGFGDRVVVGRREDGLTATRLRALAAGGARIVREATADAVLYLGVNGPAFPVALFAAARAGVPLVPVNYRLGAEQLDALLANHPRAHVIADAGRASVVEGRPEGADPGRVAGRHGRSRGRRRARDVRRPRRPSGDHLHQRDDVGAQGRGSDTSTLCGLFC
jgi:acyl-CoA synthetase (AMP-forming)/AMP-acid ligase II